MVLGVNLKAVPNLMLQVRTTCTHSRISLSDRPPPDPATGEVIGTCPESTAEDAQAAIDAASSAFPEWKAKTGRERSIILRRWHDLVLANKKDLATMVSCENGKAQSDAAGEVLFAASFLEWFAEEAPRIYGDVIPHTNPTSRTMVLKEPIGVCAMITP
jgi:succinate-semialdehyde dehydrogenase / glutarate-semialdehyde dehydrogenase